jgi:hypothetical protein
MTQRVEGTADDRAGGGPERQTAAGDEQRSELELLSIILQRATRAGIDPQRVVVALGLTQPTIAALRQHAGTDL